jgi:hypothetical protein
MNIYKSGIYNTFIQSYKYYEDELRSAKTLDATRQANFHHQEEEEQEKIKQEHQEHEEMLHQVCMHVCVYVYVLNVYYFRHQRKDAGQEKLEHEHREHDDMLQRVCKYV